MSVRAFFDKTAIIKRSRPIAGTDRSKVQSTATVDGNFQQLDRETVERVEGVFGEDYVLYLDFGTDIKEGDIVVCKENGEQYKVTEVMKAEMMGIEYFKQVYITKVNEN